MFPMTGITTVLVIDSLTCSSEKLLLSGNIDLFHPHHHGNFIGIYIQDAPFRVDRCAAPFCTTAGGWKLHDAICAMGCIDRTHSPTLDFIQYKLMGFRRNSCDFRFREVLPHKRQRFHGERLRWPDLLTDKRGRGGWDRSFLDRK